jgi:hypothetical protein
MRFFYATILSSLLLFQSACLSPKPAHFDTITVRGTPEFQKQVTNALQLLKTKTPSGYRIVTNDIGIIRQAKRSGMRAWTSPPVFDLSVTTASYSLTWCAGSIAHDSMHSELYHDYLRQNPTKRHVPDDVWTGEASETLCSGHQIRVLQELNAPLHEINWCSGTNKYWDIGYRNRSW